MQWLLASWPCGTSSSPFLFHHVPRTAVQFPGTELPLSLSLRYASDPLYAAGWSSFPSRGPLRRRSPKQPCFHGSPDMCAGGVFHRFVVPARAWSTVFTVSMSLIVSRCCLQPSLPRFNMAAFLLLLIATAHAHWHLYVCLAACVCGGVIASASVFSGVTGSSIRFLASLGFSYLARRRVLIRLCVWPVVVVVPSVGN
ncbi:hypothetical protein MRX96_036867 [Rhipicephalus microplus]